MSKEIGKAPDDQMPLSNKVTEGAVSECLPPPCLIRFGASLLLGVLTPPVLSVVSPSTYESLPLTGQMAVAVTIAVPLAEGSARFLSWIRQRHQHGVAGNP